MPRIRHSFGSVRNVELLMKVSNEVGAPVVLFGVLPIFLDGPSHSL
jgi:hypothetical protein